MRFVLISLCGFLVAGLSACGNTNLERAVSGGLIGAGAATVLNVDPVTGAIIGAGAGVVTK